MKKLELVVPPAVVFGLAAGLVIAFDFLFPLGRFDFEVAGELFVVFSLMGMFAGILGVATVYSNRTTINPGNPEKTTKLVTVGIYRLSRNPMYLGLALILYGWIFFQKNWFGLIALILFIVYMNRFQIIPEEKILEAKFGEEYLQYKNKVRRWL